VIKKIAALLLFFAFAVQTFGQGITLLNFYIHQKSIVATQCENRYRPMLHCNGQCVLAKKLQQQERKEQQNPELKLQNKSEVSSSRSFFITNLASLLPGYTSYILLSDRSTIDRSFSIFHPPCY
jgi:hypothetical protein